MVTNEEMRRDLAELQRVINLLTWPSHDHGVKGILNEKVDILLIKYKVGEEILN